MIPACAGSRARRGLRANAGPGHPCVCGEQVSVDRTVDGHVGSSLRVRGTGHLGDACGSDHRVIPACAGNGSESASRLGVSTGHPCVCGERTVNHDNVEIWVGSSLRVRGTDDVAEPEQVRQRVIPACAGNGRRRRTRAGSPAGHPCVCGERTPTGEPLLPQRSSSLRVRGTDCLSWYAIEFSCQIQPL